MKTPHRRKPASATIHRDLRSGTPIWLVRRRRPPVPHGPLLRNPEPEIVVVGAGICGAFITDALVTAGHRVVVLDRRGPLLGSTPASTALLQFEIDTPLSKLAGMIGTEKAMRAWWRSATSVDYLRARVSDLDIDCGFAERSSLYLAGSELAPQALRAEAELRRRAGLRSSYLDRAAVRRFGIARDAAIRSRGAAEADPVRLAAGLWRSSVERGAKIYAPVDVLDVAAFKDHVRLKVRSGRHRTVRSISAGWVIFATGYETLKFLRPEGYRVVSTWAYATRPQRSRLWPEQCLIWEAASPYLYARTDRQGRVLVGGEDADFTDAKKRDALTTEKIATIEKKLAKLLPRIDAAPAYAWSGTFGTSRTGLPLIGAVPGHRRCLSALGFGGNGITFSALAAQMLQRKISGITDPDEDLFSLSR